MKKEHAAALLLLLTAALLLLGPIPVRLGTGDFRAYWSAAYLLRQGENFADPARLLAVEEAFTGWRGGYPIVTWNPPWLLTMLLPFTLVSFARAAWLWLWSNIILVFGGALLVWQTVAARERLGKRGKRFSLLAPPAALFFLPTLWALWMGQVNILVFAGLAGFLHWQRRERPLTAGAALALTMVKPHLVYVTVPLLLLHALYRRNWRLLAGFGGLLLLLTGIVWGIRPTFLADYTATVGSGSLLAWETPTLGGVLGAYLGWEWSKWMGLIILPAAIMVWWRRGKSWSVPDLTAGTLFISVLTAPFGWQYDLVVLLVPLLGMAVWLAAGRLGRTETVLVLILLIAANIGAALQRSQAISEVHTFWLPLLLAALYGWVKMRIVWN